MSFRAVEHAGIREPRTAGTGVSPVFLAQDPDSGVWGFTTDPREAEAAFTQDASGLLGIDSDASTHHSGVSVLIRGGGVIAFTTS